VPLPIVTTNAVITCSHGGQVVLAPRPGRLVAQAGHSALGGQPVGAPIAGCLQLVCSARTSAAYVFTPTTTRARSAAGGPGARLQRRPARRLRGRALPAGHQRRRRAARARARARAHSRRRSSRAGSAHQHPTEPAEQEAAADAAGRRPMPAAASGRPRRDGVSQRRRLRDRGPAEPSPVPVDVGVPGFDLTPSVLRPVAMGPSQTRRTRTSL